MGSMGAIYRAAQRVRTGILGESRGESDHSPVLCRFRNLSHIRKEPRSISASRTQTYPRSGNGFFTRRGELFMSCFSRPELLPWSALGPL